MWQQANGARPPMPQGMPQMYGYSAPNMNPNTMYGQAGQYQPTPYAPYGYPATMQSIPHAGMSGMSMQSSQGMYAQRPQAGFYPYQQQHQPQPYGHQGYGGYGMAANGFDVRLPLAPPTFSSRVSETPDLTVMNHRSLASWVALALALALRPVRLPMNLTTSPRRRSKRMTQRTISNSPTSQRPSPWPR